jgi:hypothetical protein
LGRWKRPSSKGANPSLLSEHPGNSKDYHENNNHNDYSNCKSGLKNTRNSRTAGKDCRTDNQKPEDGDQKRRRTRNVAHNKVAFSGYPTLNQKTGQKPVLTKLIFWGNFAGIIDLNILNVNAQSINIVTILKPHVFNPEIGPNAVHQFLSAS